MGGSMFSILILVLMLAVMYLLLIRPQKKKEKQTNAMRAGLQVGDEIVTIGGIVCKIVKTKDETIVVQVAPDKVKMEMHRWAVSRVVKEGTGRAEKTSTEDYREISDAEENEVRKAKPKRMKKAAPVEETPVEEAPSAKETAESAEKADKGV